MKVILCTDDGEVLETLLPVDDDDAETLSDKQIVDEARAGMVSAQQARSLQMLSESAFLRAVNVIVARGKGK